MAAAIKAGKCHTPTTYVTHGTADDRVPIVQADDVVDALKAKGAQVEYERIDGINHLFDRELDRDMDGMYSFAKMTLGM